MLRPPMIVIWLSMVNVLLCIRRFTPLEVADRVQVAGAAAGERVEDANLEVRMRVERGQPEVVSLGLDVIEQQADADARGRPPEAALR